MGRSGASKRLLEGGGVGAPCETTNRVWPSSEEGVSQIEQHIQITGDKMGRSGHLTRRVITNRLWTCWVHGSGRTSDEDTWLDTQERSQGWKWGFAIINQRVIVEAMNVSVLSLPVGVVRNLHGERAARRVKSDRKKFRGDSNWRRRVSRRVVSWATKVKVKWRGFAV